MNFKLSAVYKILVVHTTSAFFTADDGELLILLIQTIPGCGYLWMGKLWISA